MAILIVTILPRPGRAERPTFSLESGIERQSTIGADFETISDTYNQSYSLNWGGAVTDRLTFSTAFKITVDDAIVSDGVDTKTLVPSAALALINPVWDLNMTVEDSITMSNEFNKDRSDAVSSSFAANLFLKYLPPLKTKFDRVYNYQEDLSDKLDEKLDVTTSYTIGTDWAIDAAYKETEVEDFMESTKTEEKNWNSTVSYGRAVWGGLKFNDVVTLGGTRSIDIDDLAGSYEVASEHTFQNQMKFALSGFPGVESSLELANNRAFTSGKHTGSDKVDLSLSLAGGSHALGSLKPTLTLGKQDESDPDPANQKATVSGELVLELTGSPTKYMDYTVQTSRSLVTTKTGIDPSGQSTQESAFDVTVTLKPRQDTTVETAFNHSDTQIDGEVTTEGRSLKIDFNYSGQFSNVAGLKVTPTLAFNDSYDRVSDTMTKRKSLALKVDYITTWPETVKFSLLPSFSWDKNHLEEAVREVGLEYSVETTVSLVAANIKLSLKGGVTNVLNDEIDGGDYTLGREGRIAFSPKLRGRVSNTWDYSYINPDNDEKQDALKMRINYSYPRFFDSVASLSFENSRSFGGPKDVERTVAVKWNMTF